MFYINISNDLLYIFGVASLMELVLLGLLYFAVFVV